MLFEVVGELEEIRPIAYLDISRKFKKREQKLEDFLRQKIGNEIFPEYMVFGNERNRQKEADLFAVDGNGSLVILN